MLHSKILDLYQLPGLFEIDFHRLHILCVQDPRMVSYVSGISKLESACQPFRWEMQYIRFVIMSHIKRFTSSNRCNFIPKRATLQCVVG